MAETQDDDDVVRSSSFSSEQERRNFRRSFSDSSHSLNRPSETDFSNLSIPSTPTPSLKTHTGKVIHSGWLIKQGHVWKSWKKRYFVLQSRINICTGTPYGILQYYNNSKFGKLKGELQISSPIQVRSLDVQKIKRPYCFEIVKGFYILLCQGVNEQDTYEWIHHLQSILIPYGTTTVENRTIRSRSLEDLTGQNVASDLRHLMVC